MKSIFLALSLCVGTNPLCDSIVRLFGVETVLEAENKAYFVVIDPTSKDELLKLSYELCKVSDNPRQWYWVTTENTYKMVKDNAQLYERSTNFNCDSLSLDPKFGPHWETIRTLP